MPLLERVRVEVYLPDLPSSEYQNLLRAFEEEFTYAFGGATIMIGLEGSYLSQLGERIPDRINLPQDMEGALEFCAAQLQDIAPDEAARLRLALRRELEYFQGPSNKSLDASRMSGLVSDNLRVT